jgi:BirA family transcriptional regulator, biotin operon repressor / biotin---[acetyl-CoA-carboxylase] ligase
LNDNHLDPDKLKDSLKPFRLYFYDTIHSTSDEALSLRRQRKLYAPAVVLARHQTAGRGRGSNSWWAGDGSIAVTFVVPADEATPPQQVPLLAGLAVHRAVSPLVGAGRLQIKWPNDLWSDDLKLAGLLCERYDGADFIGLGLNVNVVVDDIPHSLRHRVTSVAAVAGRPFRLGDVLTAIAGQFEAALLRREYGTFGTVLAACRQHDALAGRTVRVTEPGGGQPIVGVGDGLDHAGRLVIRTESGVRAVVAGSVELYEN